MNIELVKIDDTNGEIHIQITPEDYQPNVEKSLKEYRRKAHIPGFRQGMVPLGHIQRLYGKQIKDYEINELAQNSLSEYLQKGEIKFYGGPVLNEEKSVFLTDEKTDIVVTYIFNVGLRVVPKITLNKRNKITSYKILVDDEQVEDFINDFKLQYSELQDVDSVEETDTVTGNFKQLDADKKVMENGIVSENAIIKIQRIEDNKIKKQFIGKKNNSKVIFSPTKAFGSKIEISHILKINEEEAINLNSNFEFKIKSISRNILPEINETFLAKTYPNKNIETVEQFYAKIRNDIENQNQRMSQFKFEQQIKEYLLNKCNMPLPEDFLKQWLLRKNEKMTVESLEKDWDKIVKDIKWQTIIDELSEKYKIDVTEDEVLESAKDEIRLQMMYYYGMSDFPEENLSAWANKNLEKEEEHNRISFKAIEVKVIKKIKEIIEIEEVYVSYKDFQKLK